MKKLTVISLILMVPTFIVSFFGMNVPLPFVNSGWLGVGFVVALCIISSLAARVMLEDRPPRKKVKTAEKAVRPSRRRPHPTER